MISPLRILLAALLLALYVLGQDQGTGEVGTGGSADAASTSDAETTTLETTSTAADESTTEAIGEGGGGGGETGDGPTGAPAGGSVMGQPSATQELATCDPCFRNAVKFKEMAKKYPPSYAYSIWTALCDALFDPRTVKKASNDRCLETGGPKELYAPSAPLLTDPNQDPMVICFILDLCNSYSPAVE